VRNQLIDLSYDGYKRAQDTPQLRATVEPFMIRAAALAEGTIMTEPYSAFYYTRLLHLYINLVAWDTAHLAGGESILQALIAMSPERPTSYLGGGHLYTTARQYDTARLYYDHATELYPSWGEPYYHKGIVELYQGHIDQANQYFDRAQDLGFTFVTFQNLNVIAGILESQGRTQLAQEYRMRIVDELPQDINGYIELAKFYYRIGRYDATYQYLVQALKLEPSHEVVNQLIVELNKTDSRYEIPHL
jgi:tetratricopeptide (TPR) repeat protein